MNESHRAGFVSIIGRPNVGKSTIMNRLVGENLSIITSKAQTTRHRIRGFFSGPDFQIVYSDTPGLLLPQYDLQRAMMGYVKIALQDADVILLVVEPGENYDERLTPYLSNVKVPRILVLNKTDLIKENQIKERTTYWQEKVHPDIIVPASALKRKNMDLLLASILEHLPYHPAYYPKDELTDRNERFFASEIIREKIFLLYDQEVPYSVEVVVEAFKDEDNLIRIQAVLFVERDSQKGILIGKGGEAIKQVGVEARKDMETFFGKKVFLETRVKVNMDWRKNKQALKKFGYIG